ncbi:MAG: sigma 54-interacting transcriptional regulator, partial [Planctomycetaceae bacterium]|nr:sigma 54-interacting transcriptional regulator [Planctomycetaceae bacterium]
MQKPLIVCCLQSRSSKGALQSLDCDLIRLTVADQLLTTEFPQPPRLFVIQTVPHDHDATRAVILSLRSQWPLTDVLVWAPQAEGTTVRTYFQAGAQDVILNRQESKLVEVIESTLENQKFLPRMHDLSRQRSKGARFESMLSRSSEMWDLFELCTRVAPTDATVLIVGETGTGKELLARAVHRRSGREGRFVAANCASIPPDLINSELFGHEKGAFTGADRAKKGLVMHANKGTLFLDEIG